MSKLSPANGHYREAWIRPPSTQRSGLAELNDQFTTASRLTEIKRCFAYSEESSRGGQIELYKGRMDAAPREPDDGRHGHDCCRSKRPLGSSERIIRRRQRARQSPADVKTKSIEALRQVSAVLAAKAPGDAAAFKSWLRQISQGTAEGASEGGGLLGIGGVQVSDAEKATLAEISAALGI